MKWFQKRTNLLLCFVMLAAKGAAGESDALNIEKKAGEPALMPKLETGSETEVTEQQKPKENPEAGAGEERQPTLVLGWKEWVKIGTKADIMRGKLDSGARTSSIHAENVEEFERDGQKWVRFSLRNPGKEGAKSILVKAPLERIARVKNADGSEERRYVVELSFQIGEHNLREQFTLNDRAGMTCPILIGRNALRHLGYVDSSRVDLISKKASQ